MTRRVAAALACLLVSLAPAACGSGGSGADVPAAALCAKTPWTWLPAADMGGVAAFEAPAEAAFSPEAIEALLNAAGYPLPEPIKHGSRLVRFRYGTQDRGKAAEATGVVVVPTGGTPPAGGFPALLVLHGTSGYTDACAVSQDLVVTSALAGLAGLGFVVVAPDFLYMNGLGEPAGRPTPYIVAEATAVASLDALRALPGVLDAAGLADAVKLSGQRVVVGPSQGGHAVLSTLRYAARYAPELPFAGAIAQVPVSRGLYEARTGAAALDHAMQYGVAMMTAWPAWYEPESVHDRLAQVFVEPHATELPDRLLASCDASTLIAGLSGGSDLLTPAAAAAFEAWDWSGLPPWDCWVRENDLTTTTLDPIGEPPTLFVIGESDDLVDPEAARASFQALCGRGMKLEFLECAGAGHMEAPAWSLPEQIAFLRARLAGEPLAEASACVLAEPRVCQGTPKR